MSFTFSNNWFKTFLYIFILSGCTLLVVTSSSVSFCSSVKEDKIVLYASNEHCTFWKQYISELHESIAANNISFRLLHEFSFFHDTPANELSILLNCSNNCSWPKKQYWTNDTWFTPGFNEDIICVDPISNAFFIKPGRISVIEGVFVTLIDFLSCLPIFDQSCSTKFRFHKFLSCDPLTAHDDNKVPSRSIASLPFSNFSRNNSNSI